MPACRLPVRPSVPEGEAKKPRSVSPRAATALPERGALQTIQAACRTKVSTLLPQTLNMYIYFKWL